MKFIAKEADIIVYANDELTAPWIVVECKKPEVTEQEFARAVDQAFSYAVAEGGKYVWVTGNWRGLEKYYRGAKRRWRYWLNRRSAQRDMAWERFSRMLERYPLPPPKVVHSVYA